MKKLSDKIFLIFGIILVLYSYFVEPNRLEIKNYKIQDRELSGVKIVFASDFHIKPNQEKRLGKIVEMINAQNPDIVLYGGDFMSGHIEGLTMPIDKIAQEKEKEIMTV